MTDEVALPSAPDAELLARLRARESGAYELLVRREAPRVLAVGRRILGCEEDARDAAQETFLAVYQKISGFESGSALSTWIHRIAVNASLMKLRSRKRRPEDAIEDLLPGFSEDGHTDRSYAPWEAPEMRGLEEREIREAVRGAMERLPEDYRNVLLLRDIEEMDTGETAELLGITEGAVRTRLHRARQALRTLLERSIGKPKGTA